MPTPAKAWIMQLRRQKQTADVHWVSRIPLKHYRRSTWLPWLWGQVRWWGQGSRKASHLHSLHRKRDICINSTQTPTKATITHRRAPELHTAFTLPRAGLVSPPTTRNPCLCSNNCLPFHFQASFCLSYMICPDLVQCVSSPLGKHTHTHTLQHRNTTHAIATVSAPEETQGGVGPHLVGDPPASTTENTQSALGS